MSRLEEIEAAIEVLPREQFFRLVTWLWQKFADEWDPQIEEDVKAGRLDTSAPEALAEYQAGRTKPFPPDEEPCHRPV